MTSCRMECAPINKKKISWKSCHWQFCLHSNILSASNSSKIKWKQKREEKKMKTRYSITLTYNLTNKQKSEFSLSFFWYISFCYWQTILIVVEQYFQINTHTHTFYIYFNFDSIVYFFPLLFFQMWLADSNRTLNKWEKKKRIFRRVIKRKWKQCVCFFSFFFHPYVFFFHFISFRSIHSFCFSFVPFCSVQFAVINNNLTTCPHENIFFWLCQWFLSMSQSGRSVFVFCLSL